MKFYISLTTQYQQKRKNSHGDLSLVLLSALKNDNMHWGTHFSPYWTIADGCLGSIMFSFSSGGDIADLAHCRTSSDGGTGKTRGTELAEHLLKSITSIGPLRLFR